MYVPSVASAIRYLQAIETDQTHFEDIKADLSSRWTNMPLFLVLPLDGYTICFMYCSSVTMKSRFAYTLTK